MQDKQIEQSIPILPKSISQTNFPKAGPIEDFCDNLKTKGYDKYEKNLKALEQTKKYVSRILCKRLHRGML